MARRPARRPARLWHVVEPMPTGAPLRAVFLDVGETLMRPDPTWEHVYARAFADFGVTVEKVALQVALRSVTRCPIRQR